MIVGYRRQSGLSQVICLASQNRDHYGVASEGSSMRSNSVGPDGTGADIGRSAAPPGDYRSSRTISVMA